MGQFQNDKIEGTGIVIFEEGNMIISNFKESKAEGQVYMYENIKQEWKIY